MGGWWIRAEVTVLWGMGEREDMMKGRGVGVDRMKQRWVARWVSVNERMR